jgi:hypothetical protein
MPQRVLDQLRTSINRGRPFGGDAWIGQVVKRLGLEHTVRDPWRPKKEANRKTTDG